MPTPETFPARHVTYQHLARPRVETIVAVLGRADDPTLTRLDKLPDRHQATVVRGGDQWLYNNFDQDQLK